MALHRVPLSQAQQGPGSCPTHHAQEDPALPVPTVPWLWAWKGGAERQAPRTPGTPAANEPPGLGQGKQGLPPWGKLSPTL